MASPLVEAPAQVVAAPSASDFPPWKNVNDEAVGLPFPVHSLKAGEVSRLLKLPQDDEEVWQLFVAPISAFQPRAPPAPVSPPGGPKPPVDMTPVRPFCVFILGLAPHGRVLAHNKCSPPDELPDMRTVLENCMQAMFHPPPSPEERARGLEEGPPRRPARLAFVDAGMAAVCAQSLADIGVTATVSSLHPSANALVHSFSNSLIQRGNAVRNARHARPPLRGVDGMTDALLKGLFALTAQFLALKPWDRVSERQCLRVEVEHALTLPKEGGGAVIIPKGAVWAGVLGQESIRARIAALQRGEDPSTVPPVVRGLAVYYRRHDAEQHHMAEVHMRLRAMERAGANATGTGVDTVKRPVAVPNPLDAVCTYCGRKGEEERPGGEGKVDVAACSGCKLASYCSSGSGVQSACQRADWKTHQALCKEFPANPPPDPQIPADRAAGRFFALRESMVIFDQAAGLATGDVDCMRQMNALPPPEAVADFPFIITLRCGVTDRPNLTEVVWLCRALSAVLAMARAHPDALTTTLPMDAAVQLDLRDSTRPGGARRTTLTAPRVRAAEGAEGGKGKRDALPPPASDPVVPWYEACGDTPLASARTDPILQREEMDKMRLRVAVEDEYTSRMVAGDVQGAKDAITRMRI